MICGAFYPNYFASSDIDETDVMKVMSGHDPFTTVMVCSIVFVDIVRLKLCPLLGGNCTYTGLMIDASALH